MTSRPTSDQSTTASAATDGHLLAAVDEGRRRAVIARLARTDRAGSTNPDASFHAVLLRTGRLPLVIAEIGIPSGADRWAYRASGRWVEIVAETPAVHWSYGLEAFALAIDEPSELLERGYGHRTALGWELDFESDPSRLDRPAPGLEHQIGRVDGLVLTTPDAADGDGAGIETPFAGPAERRSWLGHPTATAGPDPGLDRWHPDLPAIEGPPIEVGLPLREPGPARPPVWWVGHDGTRLTSRWTRPTSVRALPGTALR